MASEVRKRVRNVRYELSPHPYTSKLFCRSAGALVYWHMGALVYWYNSTMSCQYIASIILLQRSNLSSQT